MSENCEISVTENTTGPIVDLDCGEGANPDAGKDICAVTDKDENGFGEDTEKPSSFTLSLGDELTSEIDSSQGDKLEVGNVMPGDDGDGSYYILVSDDEDPSKLDKVYFSGDVAAGESFTANGIDGKFGSETFVHIYSSDGGTLLQTINFHTSCSAPLVIGDQYGSITLEGAALEGKDSGTIYTVGQTETDGDAGVVYEITGGNDADDFTVDPDTGEVTFINAPDFENPTDSDMDNKYDVEVTAFFVDAHGVKTGEICEVKPLEVCVEDDCINILENTSPVIADLDCGEGENPDAGMDICAVTHKDMNGFGEDTEKPSSFTLSLGDELTSEVNSTQGDKLEVGAVMSGADDGSPDEYYILVSDDEDPSKLDKVYFSGDVNAGESFTAEGIDGKFGSETFVHIFASDGGTLLQTINFHTSCSAPLVIGDQYGSITLEGAALEGKDSGTIYTVGATETDGDAGVVYEITGGDVDADGNSLFTVDADGKVTFIDPPDFENPQDANGDNKYDVEVTAYEVDEFGNRVVCEVKTLEVCVEDDCINILENTSPVIADLDCGEGENPDLGKDICAVTDKDENGFGEDTEKPSSFTLSLGDELTSEIDSTQGDKLEVGRVMPGDDGDGSYFILVSDNEDPSKLDKVYFSGDVGTGQSFTANGIDGKFGSETYIHIFSSDGGTLLQTINFHTSCSSPLVIGDQYGSITLEGATLEGKDSGTVYEVGGTSAPGDEGVVYTIKDGPGSDLFEVNADGEVSFKEAPDFDDPKGIEDADGNPTNNYEVVVLATLEDGTVTEKPVEICVDDQDCIEILENTTGPVTDLDATVDCPVESPADVGMFVCQAIDDQGLEKPSELTLTLGDIIDPKLSDFQPDGKSSVVTAGASEDGNGLLRVIVSDDDDPSKLDTVYFDGAVSFGQSFTALASNAGDSSFSSNTYIHILDDDGTLLQTIQYHTSCSVPIVIGDQVGSVTVTGVGALNKDTGQVVSFGGTTMTPKTLVEGEIVYSIVGGDDAGAFTVDPDTGEVSFIDPPDFEASSVDGDDNYEVIVRATAKNDPDCFTDTPVEICVKDVVEVGSLSGRYFCDTNDNDVDDGQGTDPGVAGVVVTAFDAAGNAVGTAVTDATGNYTISGLAEGTYSVVFTDPDNVLEGKALVTPNVGGNEAIDSDAIGNTDSATIDGIVVNAGQDTPDNDAGAEYTASLGDRVFLDADRDGIQDTGEAGVASVTVTLTGGGADGVIGTGGDDTTATATTDANGNYLFEDLDPGTEYKVTFSDLPPGTEFTPIQNNETGPDGDAGDSDADPANGMTDPVVLAPGEINTTVDAGVVLKLGALSGRYFCDTNDNDVDDGQAVDPGVAGVLVTLLDETGAPVLDGAGNSITTTTGAEGLYSFGGLEPGTYGVQFTDPDGVLDGKQLVAPNDPDGNGDDTNDSDAVGDTDTSTIPGIVVTPGDETADNDAGAEKTASLGDRVFLDENRNGLDDGEAGVAGVTVTLTGGGDDGVLGTADDTTEDDVTDANGAYLFEGLNPGEAYKVTFDLSTATSEDPADIEFTAQDAGDDALDSDADPANGMTDPVVLAPGEINTTVDAGVVLKLGALSGRYFCDTNDNDVDDGQAVDPGVAGVLVTLLDETGAPVLDGAGNSITTTTGAEGLYSFGGLEPGTYGVQFTDPDGVLDGKQLVAPNDPDGNGDDTNDSDAVGDTDTSTIPGIVVTPGDETADNDAGAEKTASLGDRVFLDENRNGLDDGEAGVAGVTVTLTGGGDDGVLGTADDTTEDDVTDANGAYLFEGLNPGEAYKVTFDLSTATSEDPADIEFTAQDAGDDALDSDADPANGMTDPVVLAPGEINTTVDAGVVLKLGALSGRYFCDTNDNDVDDGQAVDPGVAGVLVTLLDETGAPVLDGAGNSITTTTGAEGLYSFGGLEPGTYGVQFTDPDGVLDGKQLVAPNDPDGNGDDTNDSDAVGDTDTSTIPGIVVTPGDETADNDAGAEKTASLGDRVFLDENRNGLDDGEAGVAGVTVTLTGGGDDGVLGTADDTTEDDVTDANGAYLFEGLNPGEAYKVTFDLSTATSEDPADIEFTAQDAGDDALDSDADPANGMTDPVVLAPGEINTTVDAGVVLKLGALSGRYFCDTNDNDVDDGQAVDPGVAGVLVTLLDETGAPVLDGAGNSITTTTGAEGLYSFGGLEPGTYGVQFTDPDGVLDGKQLVAPNDPDGNGDDTNDSDAVGDTDTSTIPGIVVTPGDETADNDAGAEKTASLGDFVFEDLDADGIQDTGEAGIGDVGVTLTGGGDDGLISTAGDNDTFTTTTDSTGFYQFTGLNPGEEYQVSFDTPAGFVPSPVDAGTDDAVDSDGDPADGLKTDIVTLTSGETNPTIDQGFYELASLGDRVFEDTNGDGIQGDPADEPGVDNVTVKLFKDGADTGQTTTTDANGAYSFTGLVPGTYSVMFVAPAGFAFTTANAAGVNDALDSDANPANGMTDEITLSSGEFNGTLDAGLVQTNNPPAPEPDVTKFCADDITGVDVLANDTDPDGDALSIVTVGGIAPDANGQVLLSGTAIVDRDGTVSSESFTGLSVTVQGDNLVIDADAAFAFLDIGDEAEVSISYSVSDGNGGTGSTELVATICGEANSLASLVDSLPDTLTYEVVVQGGGFAAPSAFELKVLGPAGSPLEGVVFEQAYCLSYFENVPTDGTFNGAPLLTGNTVNPEPFAGSSLSGTSGSDLGARTGNTDVSTDAADNLDFINWIMAEEFHLQDNEDGANETYTEYEVQLAIWEFTDSAAAVWGGNGIAQAFEDDGLLGANEPLGTLENVDEIVQAALASGNGFEAGDGDVASFIIDPTNPSSNQQPFIVAFDYDEYDCIC